MTLWNPLEKTKLKLAPAIVAATVVVGLLDALDGVVAYFLALHYNPFQVLQYIASGLQGPAAFQGGLASVLLGLVIHFFIAFVVVAIYILASRSLRVLATQAVAFGLLYGALVYVVMTYVVLPHSAVPATAFSLGLFVNGLLGHALFVGLPTALYAARVDRSER